MEAVAVDGARLAVETFGDRPDPPILLIAGAAATMELWDPAFCAALARRGRFVIRYDHRDTGRSTTYAHGAPPYTGADLAGDALAVLDALGIERAHLAGLSMGGGIAQALALGHRERVATLTLMSTTSIEPGGPELPGPSEELGATFAHPPPEPDWADRDSALAHLVELERPYVGTFDAAALRARAARAYDRSPDPGAAANHWIAEPGEAPPGRLAELDLPVLVIHGTADPLFGIEHGRALAAAIPGATLLELEGVGHEPPPRRTWDAVIAAIAAHTA